MTNIIGIDLGTTMSAIAKLNDRGKPEIIPTSDGERIMPSVTVFKDYEEVISVGEAAKNSYPVSVEKKIGAKEFKRQMTEPYFYIEEDNKRFYVERDGKKCSPEFLSSIILKKLIQDASKESEKINDAVISVPAYFKEVERNKTIEAARLAGLNVVNIINEPTAAALYYVTNNNVNGRFLIYDLGGGTFDVTILEARGTDIKILSSEGDHRLGGVDFDGKILEIFSERYEAETGEKLYTTLEDKEELLLQAERTKKKLSKSQSVKERLVGEGGRAGIEISREEFEEKISTYISRTELLVEQVFDSAGLEFYEIDEVLLVGGSTRIPVVSKSIEETTGKKPITAVNVDEAVVLGAAIQAGLILAKQNPARVAPSIINELKEIKMKDVTNHSYGTISVSYDEILEKEALKNTIILKKNTSLPCENRETFYTRHEGQSEVRVTITQGEYEDPDLINIIKEDVIKLPIGRPAGQPLEITYSYDENGIMNCQVVDINSGKSKDIHLEMNQINENSIDIDNFEIE